MPRRGRQLCDQSVHLALLGALLGVKCRPSGKAAEACRTLGGTVALAWIQGLVSEDPSGNQSKPQSTAALSPGRMNKSKTEGRGHCSKGGRHSGNSMPHYCFRARKWPRYRSPLICAHKNEEKNPDKGKTTQGKTLCFPSKFRPSI